jgi:hypothetical protein
MISQLKEEGTLREYQDVNVKHGNAHITSSAVHVVISLFVSRTLEESNWLEEIIQIYSAKLIIIL